MSIFAHPPVVVYNGSSVCVAFNEGDRQVSLQLDNNCSGDRSKKLSRGDIRVFVNREDVTELVFGTDGIVVADMDNFEKATKWLKQTSWGFDAQ